ncbi:synaptotagmin-13 [Callorhinchus milii]|uniref:synaptotagmin-13 n=1 Tax=Callorhinchus milii TaxID=7868 RepID=UPI001C3F57EF|nr:synaptotagmin-13 [Callorhinchus milii]
MVVSAPLTALGFGLGIAMGLVGVCVLALLCRCLRRKQDKLGLQGSLRDMVWTVQPLPVKKTTEAVQPKTLLTSPAGYTPKPAGTSAQLINVTNCTLGTGQEPPSSGPGEAGMGEAGPGEAGMGEAGEPSLLMDVAEDLIAVPTIATADEVSFGDEAEWEVPGGWGPMKLHYALKHSCSKSEFHVTVIEAAHIQAVEGAGPGNCYVVGTLVTELGRAEAKTSVQAGRRGPVWEETLVFPLSEQHVRSGSLQLALYGCDRYSRRHCVGTAEVSLRRMALMVRTDTWHCLKPPEQSSPASCAEVLLSISYLPAANRLIVVVLKCRHVNPGTSAAQPIDVWVNLTLTHGGCRLRRKRTRRVRQGLRPVWNELLVLALPGEALAHCALGLELLSQDSTGQRLSLGHCCLSLASSGSHRTHWQDILNSPRRQVAMWHKLPP